MIVPEMWMHVLIVLLRLMNIWIDLFQVWVQVHVIVYRYVAADKSAVAVDSATLNVIY